MAELLATLRERDRTVDDVLDDLALEHGLHATDAFSVRVDDLSLIPPIVERLHASGPDEIGGVPVRSTEDLEHPDSDLPGTPGARFYLEDDTRIIVRPSGTEPKLKVYVEVIVPVESRSELRSAGADARERLSAVVATMRDLTSPK